MGCTEDEYNLEDFDFSDNDPIINQLNQKEKEKQEKLLKKNKNKKKKKKTKKKTKNKKKEKEIKSESENKTVISKQITSNKSTENEKIISEKTETNEKEEEKEEEEKNEEESENNENEENEENESEESNEQEKTNEEKNTKEENKNSSQSSYINSNSTEKNINSSDNKINTIENIDKNTKSINESKSKDKEEDNKEDKNNVDDDEDWLANFVNVTNEYNRKNIKSSISPKDPIMSNLINSKEKDLILSSEDMITYQNNNPSKKYKILDLIDSGSYGKIYKAVNILTKNLVAIKKTKKYYTKNIDIEQPVHINVKNEIEIIKKLCHPNIARIYEVYDIKAFFFQINEYCKYGPLFDYYKFHLSEKQICIIMYQIISGVLYLHENNIMHRDLNMDNILVDHIEKDLMTAEPYFFIKIVDFGSSKIITKNKKENQIIGTDFYIAPEVIKQNYNEKCDMWSIGVILYFLIAKKPPFAGDEPKKIFEKITNEEYNKHSRKLLDCSNEVRDLLNKLLDKNVSKRLSAKEALKHPWFINYNGQGAFANFRYEDFNLILERLFNVKFLNKLAEIVLIYLVHNSPYNQEIIKIMKIFRYFNTSGNCKLSRYELKKGLYKYKIKSEVNKMVDDLFKKLEIPISNDYIEYEKFIVICIDKNTLFTKENLKNVFNYINYDKGKGITAKKIMKAFNIKEEDISEVLFNNLIIKKDKNSDMIITYSEFETIIRS